MVIIKNYLRATYVRLQKSPMFINVPTSKAMNKKPNHNVAIL